MANQPDIIAEDKQERKAVVVNFTIPSDSNIRMKEQKKLENTKGL